MLWPETDAAFVSSGDGGPADRGAAAQWSEVEARSALPQSAPKASPSRAAGGANRKNIESAVTSGILRDLAAIAS
jgi:hypothetical protein